jgi:hypothetical protein
VEEVPISPAKHEWIDVRAHISMGGWGPQGDSSEVQAEKVFITVVDISQSPKPD